MTEIDEARLREPPLDVERLAIAAAARLEGEVSRLTTALANCSQGYLELRWEVNRHLNFCSHPDSLRAALMEPR